MNFAVGEVEDIWKFRSQDALRARKLCSLWGDTPLRGRNVPRLINARTNIGASVRKVEKEYCRRRRSGVVTPVDPDCSALQGIDRECGS